MASIFLIESSANDDSSHFRRSSSNFVEFRTFESVSKPPKGHKLGRKCGMTYSLSNLDAGISST
jgi:hypothetical protein